MTEDAESTERLAHRVRLAYEAADLAAFAEILAPLVTWGPPGEKRPPCRTREEVLEWYGRAESSGVRAQVSEVSVLGDRILVGLVLSGYGPAGSREGRALRWQLLTVEEGLVVDIVGFENRPDALAWASGTAQA